MEDLKPSISLQSDEGGEMEARFADLCKNGLALDESTMRQAMVFFKESKHILLANISAIGSGSPEEVERFWSAFVVYCVTRLSRGRAKKEKEEIGVPLCQILRAFKLNVVDFFKEMPQFSLKAGYILSGLYGSDWEKRLELKELQANFVHLSLLSRYYKRAYQEFFHCETGSDQHSAVFTSTGYVSEYHRFGWLLFLALRVHALSRFKDLVTCTNGLVSILATLILHVPVKIRNFRIQDSHLLDQNGDPQTPKRHCSESRSVLVERSSFTSPVKEHLLSSSSLKLKFPPLQSAFASPTRPNPTGGGETCAETGINVFFSKIVKLAAIRIRSLCERLQLSQQSLEHIYCLIQQIISQRTALFFNRHIDQLILCSFYGIAKISQLSLTFKEIIYHYRKQPQCKSQVFRSVFVSWPPTSRNRKVGQDHIDIITFYNEIFIPSVKPLLVELASNGVTQEDNRSTTEDKNKADGQIPGSPRFSPFPNLPDMSPKKVSASHNVYVSPLRSSKMDSLLSPSSKSYYACVGESTHAFQSPSKDLTAINNRLNGGRKISGRLNFDLVSDAVVAGSLDPHNGVSSPASAAPLKVLVKCEQPDS